MEAFRKEFGEDIAEYVRLCRVDARMDALISYLNVCERKARKKGIPVKTIDEDIIRAIIGMCDE